VRRARDGEVSGGDTLEIDIRAVNSARAAIPGPFQVQDNLPADLVYVPGSTRYRFSVEGNWQAWSAIPDDGSGSAFPLDGSGFSVVGTMGKGQQLQVIFNATVRNFGQLSSTTITNTGSVEISPYGLVLPIEWTDTVYGSIGDRVWADADGDGVQDPGENGLQNIDVFADINGNGIWDAGEPKDTTDLAGNYLIAGLSAGTYTVRVDFADVVALNFGYGTTYDLDGILTQHVATVTLAAAEDRVDADFGYRIGASVGDRVWNDRDADGVQENGEPGINGVRVYLDLNLNGSYDSGEPNTVTFGDGNYYIGNLSAGSYTVRVDTSTLPSGTSQTFDLNGPFDHSATVTLLAAEHRGDLDFGYRGVLSIGDLVWEDANADGLVTFLGSTTYDIYNGRVDINNDGSANASDDGFLGTMRVINGYLDIDDDNVAPVDSDDDGLFMGYNVFNGGLDINGNGSISTADDGTATYDAYEPGVSGVRVFIDMDGDAVFDPTEPSAVTNSAGAYSIGGLYNRTYAVRVDPSTLPASYVGTYDLTAPVTDHAASVVLSGSSRTDVDFGYRNDASIGDLVWNDRDADGVRDPGEPGVEGVTVYIDSDGDNLFDQGSEPYDITDLNGNYRIENLVAGTYTLRVEFSTLPQGFTQTYDLNGAIDHEADRVLAAAEDASDVDFGYRASASFGDFVWNDADADGVQDGGEAGINGVRVYLDINGNGSFDSASEPSAVTNSSGAYSIGNLLAGTYTARIDTSTLPAGQVQTYDLNGGLDHAATFSLSANETSSDVDFGYTQQATLGDYVWNDLDADGIQDGGEPGINGVTVTAFDAANDTIAATTVTSGGGAYSFILMPGTYYLVFSTPAGFARTISDQGADTADSDASISAGRTANVTLTGGQTNLTVDAGFYQPATVFGHLYIDTNGDGDQDPGEPDLADVNVIVTDVNGTIRTVATDANGDWSASVPPGVTTANVDEADPQYPTGYTQTEGTDPTTVTAVSGANVSAGIDGYFLPGSISGTVLADTDGDGDGDAPIENVVLRLLDSLGNPVLDDFGQPITTLTGSNGNYSFGGLPPGDYCVVQDQPANFASVSDTDGPNDNVIGNVTPIAVVAGQNSGGNNFIEIELGSISGHVRADDDNNGSGDSAISGVVLNLLDSSGNPVLDGFGSPIQVATNSSGFYQFTLVFPGSYRVSQDQPPGYASVSDVDGANNNLIGDQTPIVITPGLSVTGRDFVEVEYGAISGRVFKDTNDDGTGDTVFPGVTVALLDAAGDPVDGDPNTSGVQPWTLVTGMDGSYRFPGLLPGLYQVSEVQPAGYGSVSDVDGGNLNLIGNVIPITVNPGQEVIERDFVEIELGTISGHVFVGSAPLAGVTLTLLDGNGDPVDGDPNSPGVQLVTTVTNGSGYYQFSGVRPGIYQVGQTQPYGYDSFGDIDGGDINIIGDVTPITLSPGQHSQNNDFVETLDTCPDDWTHWKFLHPSETPGGNPDADQYDNFAEFAFAMPYDNGTGSPWLGYTAWIIRPSTLAPGTLEGVFIRHKGAPLNVVYTLQYAATPGDPTVWQEIVLTPAMYSTSDNGDCTETVTIHDLETLTGLTGGKGTVRIKADLDDDGGNDEIDHTSFTEPEGWTETPLALCCRTYNNPYQREALFTGTVSTVGAQDILFTGQTLNGLITSGISYYIEVLSGENEGHRFDVTAASGDSLTLANDTDIHAATAPFNTLAGAPPANLAGDTVVLRRHWTLAEVFPPAGFGATGAPSTADEVQLFVDGAWILFWNYDDSGTHRWVRSGFGFTDQGATVIPPGWGTFFNNRTAVTSLLAYGEVRTNDFRRPLDIGNNLVGGGYPLDQSAAGPGGRAMTLATGFFGSRDFKTADTIFLWNKDANAASSGYSTYFLLNGAPVFPGLLNWAKVGDNTAASRDAEVILLGNRAVFARSKNGLDSYVSPSPWTP
jgi:large repetitive protein